jgi:hypothetical protein
MRLKPKQTVKNPKALIYRRFTREQLSGFTVTPTYDSHYFHTYSSQTEGLYWRFNFETENMELVSASEVPQGVTPIEITTQIFPGNIRASYPVVQYEDTYYIYPTTLPVFGTPEWTVTTTPPSAVIPKQELVLSQYFKSIAKYQTNNYYFVGSFDYIIKGQQEGGTTQFIKGNITPLTSMSIKYYSDTANLQPDDLVVIGKHLYSVENPETVYKQQPRPYAIHYVTLNSIL